MTGTNFWKLESKRMSSNWINRYVIVKQAGSDKNGKADRSALQNQSESEISGTGYLCKQRMLL